MAPTVDFFGTFPALHPGWLLLIYVVVPLVIVVPGVQLVSSEAKWRGSKIYSFFCNLTLFLYRFAPVVAVATLLWSAIILVNQASYTYRNVSLNKNPSYYLSVDLPAWDTLAAINYVTTDNSYNAVNAQKGTVDRRRRRRLFEDKTEEEEEKTSFYSFFFPASSSEEGQHRSLQEIQVDTTLTLAYHTEGFDNVLTTTTLQHICETELNIVKASNTTCLGSISHTNYHTIMDQLYQKGTCTPLKTPFSASFPIFSYEDNSRYVSDDVVSTSTITPSSLTPSSSIILSYFDIGSCVNMNPSDFSDMLNSYVATNSDLIVTYSSESINKIAVADDIMNNSGYYLIASSLVCYVLLVFFLRGLLLPLIVFFSFFFAVINDASFISLLNMKYFSIYNFTGYLILLCYGGNAMLLWNSAWRRQVKPATHPTIANIVTTYTTMGMTLLYITLLATITLFSMMVSPIVAIQQFGAFTGFMILFFYLAFHYIIIPCWILSSWFIIRKKYHRRFRALRSSIFPCYDHCLTFFKENKKGWNTVAIIAEFVPDDEDDDDFLDDEDEADDIEGYGRNASGSPSSRRRPLEEGKEGQESPVRRTSNRSTGRYIPAEEVTIISPNDPIAQSLPMQPDEGLEVSHFGQGRMNSVRGGSGGGSIQRGGNSIRGATAVGSMGGSVGPGGVSRSGDEEGDGEEIVSVVDGDGSMIGGSQAGGGGGNGDNYSANGGRSVRSAATGPAYRPVGTGMNDHVVSAVPVEATEAPTGSSGGRLRNTPSRSTSLLEMTHDTNFCRGKRPLKFFGFLIIILVLIGFLIVYIVSIQRFHLNLGFPTSFIRGKKNHENLSFQYQIIQKYKNDFFTHHDSNSIIITTNQPTLIPTRAPLSLRPTVGPTRIPTLSPTSGSAAPTKAPTSIEYVDYQVKGCWGITSQKDQLDDEIQGKYDVSSFQTYVAGNRNGLISDLQSVCDYVKTNRDKLDISSDWNVNRDCIYYQYLTSLNSLSVNERTVENGLVNWATTSYSAGNMLGIVSNSTLIPTATATNVKPAWICANFSVRSYISSIEGDPDYIMDKKKMWENVFKTYSVYAKSQDIPVVVTSTAFTYPLLSHQQQFPLAVSITCIVVGFVGLLAAFTLLDYGLTLFGSLSIFMIIVITVCIRLYIEGSKLDVFDYICVVSSMLLLVTFPIQLIEEYISSRAYIDKQLTIQADKALSPALSMTNKIFRSSVLFPSFLLVIVCIPCLYTSFRLLHRLAVYIIILTLVSLIFTIAFQPYLLAFGCRTRHFEKICYVEDEEEGEEEGENGEEEGSEGGGRRSVLSGQGLSGRATTIAASDMGDEEEGEELDDDEGRSSRMGDQYSQLSGPSLPMVAPVVATASRGGNSSRRNRRTSRGNASVGASSVGSRGGYSINSAVSGGVLSIPGSVVSSHNLYRSPPSYYPMAGVVDPNMISTPPPPGGMMYYPPPLPVSGGSVGSRYSSPVGGYDPRVLMQRPELLAQYQQQQQQQQQYYDPAYQQYMRQMAQQQMRTGPGNMSQYQMNMPPPLPSQPVNGGRPQSAYLNSGYGSAYFPSPYQQQPMHGNSPPPSLGMMGRQFSAPAGLHGQASTREGSNSSSNSVSNFSLGGGDGHENSMYVSPPHTHSTRGNRNKFPTAAAAAVEMVSTNDMNSTNL
jgi:hypothetical protein